MAPRRRSPLVLILYALLLIDVVSSLKKVEVEKQPPPQPKQRLARATAGLLAGLLASIILQPLDVVKTRMQSRASMGKMNVGAATLAIARTEGVQRLWAGTVPSAVRLAGGIALYFVFLGEFEALSRTMFGELRGWQAACRDFLLGGLSRGVAGFLFCPITVIKTRAEEGVLTVGGGLLAQVGVLWQSGDLFAGLAPSLLRDVPYSGVSLFLLRFLREHLVRALGSLVPLSVIGGLAGGGAALGATLITQPADVLSTQQALRGVKDHNEGGLGVLAISLQLVRARGLASLFAGTSARLTRRVLQQCFTWAVYEAVLGKR